ncbi:MAG: methyltransferase domain-containing protein [Rhodobacteraceae bacterium]|nr:methyltransferase domain-containing protein [Paracoccaceae bacterium]
MADRKTAAELLKGAYRITTPEDNVTYYADFAKVYDSDFAAPMGYIYPRAVAEQYRAHAGPEDVPVADIGCGTGLVAEALGLSAANIEGFDISPEMLAKARDKGLYAVLHEADLTRPPEIKPRFGALVSAGTFTRGHLGPEPLEYALNLARPGALAVIGVNVEHFEAKGFGPMLEQLETAGRIRDVRREQAAYYEGNDTDYAGDEAHILVFRVV